MAAAKNKQKSQGLPDNVIGLLSAADQRNGFPPGTMYSVMQQEIGGQYDRFIADPTAYHYAPNEKGQRIAAHTGKVSTAFGPFGILESTARDPGYGVSPLKDKSLEEQVRFAGDYLAARSKKGGLTAGLAGYGEGEKYAAQVASRLGAGAPVARAAVPSPIPAEAPVMVAAAPAQQVAQAAPVQAMTQEEAPVMAQAPQMQGPDPWQQFLEASRMNAPAARVADLSYGGVPSQFHMPDFMSAVAPAGGQQQPQFSMLSALKGWA